MKNIIFGIIGILASAFLISGTVFAQGMMGSNQTTPDSHTAREEAEGKIVWEKLQAREATCADLSDEDFGTLGEYFMGQMLGTSHEAMNNRMIQMMGEQGEEQMHIGMGKRLSGCDTNAAYPAGFQGFMSMMGGGMMGGFGYGGSVMGDVGIFGGFVWLLAVLDLILAGVWLWRQISKQ